MWNGMLWLGYAIRTSTASIVFIILKVLSISGVQQKVYLPDFLDSSVSKCAHLGHMRHELECVDSTKDTMHFIHISGWFLLKVGRNAFLPRLESIWCQPVSKPIGFLDGPWTFERVKGEAVCFKARQYLVEQILMLFQGIAKDTNIIKVNFNIF